MGALVAAPPAGYAPALALARERWASLEPVAQAVRCGATLASPHPVVVVLPFLNTHVAVTHPAGEARYADREGAPDDGDQILVLHYLSARGAPPALGKPITFADLPDGRFYNAAYLRRTRDPLVKVFGPDPARLLGAAAALGAEPAPLGDVAVRLRPFPAIELTVVIWRGDEELGADASVLLDDSIRQFLCAEDIAALSGLVVRRLIAAARAIKDEPCP